ncbi:MAG: hypothetical protein QM778_32575 [Myxococcales bacterium]
MRNLASICAAAVVLSFALFGAAPLEAQDREAPPPAETPKAPEGLGDSLRMTMSSGAPNQYFFRGILQSDKGFIWQSNSNLDVALYDSKEFKLIIPVGFWFSVHPGDKAKTGKGPAAWYESRLSGGIAAEGQGYRADLRLVVYSSPSGSFEDVYELMLKVDLFDDVVFAKESEKQGFRGFFPSITLANELKGARDGRDSGTYLELDVAPRARLLASKDVWIDAVLPLAIGLGLNKYYQFAEFGDTKPTNHVLGYASAGLLLDIVPRFVPARLGAYNILPSITALLPAATKDAQPGVRTVEVVAKIDSMLRF